MMPARTRKSELMEDDLDSYIRALEGRICNYVQTENPFDWNDPSISYIN